MAKNNETSNDRLKNYYSTQSHKAKEMLSKKNNWFFVSLILISLIMLVVAWLIESNTYGVDTKAIEQFDIKYIYLVLATIILIGAILVIGDYIVVYRKQKTRKFMGVVGSLLTKSYYGLSQNYDSNAEMLSAEYLCSCGVDGDLSKNLSASKGVASKIATAIYSIIMIVIGSIFAIKKINILLYILAVVGLLVSVATVLIVLYFDKYKAKYLLFIGKMCKFFYRCKLLKDYEKLYNNLVAKIMHYGSVLKFDKLYMIIEIICGFVAKFLKHLLLFFMLCATNIASWQLFIEVMFKCVILDLILDVLPLPSGVLIYELLFLTIFRNTFVSGYVLYGMVGYRIVTYFVIVVAFVIGYFVGVRKGLNKIKNN